MNITAKARTTNIILFSVSVLALALTSWFSFQTKGPHEGTINKADNFYIEMRNDEKIFHAWLYDSKFKPILNNGVTGDVKFFLNDSSTFSVGLRPFLEDEFICESIPGFYACKINFNIGGTSISGTFQNPVQIVDKK